MYPVARSAMKRSERQGLEAPLSNVGVQDIPDAHGLGAGHRSKLINERVGLNGKEGLRRFILHLYNHPCVMYLIGRYGCSAFVDMSCGSLRSSLRYPTLPTSLSTQPLTYPY